MARRPTSSRAGHWDALSALPQDLAVADPGPELMFDDRVYKRGALTLHALRLTVGDATLVEILRAWTQTHAHGTVVTDDFVDVASRHTEEPLHELFRSWLFEQPCRRCPAAGHGSRGVGHVSDGVSPGC